MEINTLLITQARYGSTRLPGKVLKKINGHSLLEILLSRLAKCKNTDKILIATTDQKQDDLIVQEANKCNTDFFRGSESDVLDRYYKAASHYRPNWIVRITSDCPLIDPALIDEIIGFAQKNKVDYCSNVLIENYPDGQDIEVFTFEALEKAWKEAVLDSDREHVTPYIRKNSSFFQKNAFTSLNYPCESDFSKIRMTVDEQADFDLIERLINDLGIEKTWKEYVEYIISNKLTELNSDIIRNEGYLNSIKKD